MTAAIESDIVAPLLQLPKFRTTVSGFGTILYLTNVSMAE